MRWMILALAAAVGACSDSPSKEDIATDVGSTDVGTDSTHNDRDLGTDSTPQDSGDPAFWVEAISVERVEQGEKMRANVRLFNRIPLDCSVGLPTVSLSNATQTGVTVTADDCFELGFNFTATAEMPVGTYQLAVQDGAGRPGDTEGIELEVVSKRGRDQGPWLDGIRPDLAANPDVRTAMVAAIDASNGRAFIAPLTHDFSAQHGPLARLDTDIAANELRIVSQNGESGDVAYGLIWADTDAVGVAWLNADGAIVGNTTSLAASGAHQLDAMHDGDDWAVAWRNANGKVEVALTTAGASDWAAGPLEVGSGQWPSLTFDATIFRVHWTTDENRDTSVGFEAPSTVSDPIDDEFGRAMCNYADKASHRACNIYNPITGDYVKAVAHQQSRETTLDLAVEPSAWPVQAETVADANTGDPIFVAYLDTFGGTTYAYFEGANTNRADAIDQHIARHGQPAGTGTPPRISVHEFLEDTILAWVQEINGKIELGTIVF